MEETEQLNPDTPQVEKKSPDAATSQEELQQDLGTQLLQAREQQGFSLAEVSERLRIRESYLLSLESGNWDNLPEETYIRGFLRQYAGLLKLDIDGELERLKSGDFHLTKPFTMPDPPIAPSRKWTIAVIVVLALFLILFNVVKNTDHHPEVVAPQTPPPAEKPLTGKTPATQPPAPAPSKAAPAPSATPSKQPAPSTPAPQAAPAKAPVAASTAASTPHTSAAPADTHHFRFTAIGQNAWIQVFDMQHTLLKEALLKSGESLSLSHAGQRLLVTCGNAAALEIRADGKLVAPAGSLGKSGEVVRDYKLVLPSSSQQ